MAKAAGIGEERDVEVGGDGRCDRKVEVIEHLHDHLTDCGGVGLDDVQVPKARVRGVMVDVDNGGVRRDALHAAT